MALTRRSQPYRLSWPLNAEQVESIDEMFQILFEDLNSTTTLASSSTTGPAGAQGMIGPPGDEAEADSIPPLFPAGSAQRLQCLSTDCGRIYDNLDFVATAVNPPAPVAGTARFHSATTQGFTRFEQDNEAATNLILGRDNVLIARNTSGAAIAKGEAVYITGSTGNVPNIAKAKADSLTTLPAVGLALDAIADNAFGQVMKLGVIGQIDTSSFSSGNRLFVSSATAGALTSTRPIYPNFVQRMGSVLVSGVGNGSIGVYTAPFLGMEESGTTATAFTFAGTASMTTLFTGDGTAAAPSHTFTSETTLGLNRKTTRQLGVAVNGAQIAWFGLKNDDTVNNIGQLTIYENIPGSAGPAVVIDGNYGSYIDGYLRVGASGADATNAVPTSILDVVGNLPSLTAYQNNGTGLLLHGRGANANAPQLYFFKTRATDAQAAGLAPTTAVLANDVLLRIGAMGADGTNYTQAGRVDLVVDGAPGLNDMPGRWVFFTTPDGSSSPVERMRIDNAGVVSVGLTGTTGGTLKLFGATSGSITLQVPAVAGTNTLTLPAGTTDFSATGGASQVVKQTSAGGAFTVATVAASDLAGRADLTGTANQIILSASGTNALAGGTAITLSTPQDLATTSTPQFAKLGLGVAPTRLLDVLGITEQARLAYDASNYASLTVGSAGGLTVALTGTNSGITFNPAGTGSFIVNSGATTAAGGALQFNANSLTTGNGLYANSSSITSGTLVSVQALGTAALTNMTGLFVSSAGATATNGVTSYAADIRNTRTNATSGTNIALYLDASGATTANYGLIVAAGRVGIGTSAPPATLTVDSSTFGIRTRQLADTTYRADFYASGAGGVILNSYKDAPSAAYQTMQLDASPLTINASSGGSVGIGGTPNQLLDLQSTAPGFQMTDTTASAKSLRVVVDANKANFYEAAGAAGSLLTLDLANNRLGIGQGTPTQNFHVTSTNANALGLLECTGTTTQARWLMQNSTGGANIATYANGSAVAGTVLGINRANCVEFALSPVTGNAALIYISGGNTSPIVFGTNGLERMRLTSGGLFGVGATAPLSKLHLEGASGWLLQDEQDTDPTATELDQNDSIAIYNKSNKFVIAYNNAGTITYVSIPLDGSTTTWTHSTSAP